MTRIFLPMDLKNRTIRLPSFSGVKTITFGDFSLIWSDRFGSGGTSLTCANGVLDFPNLTSIDKFIADPLRGQNTISLGYSSINFPSLITIGDGNPTTGGLVKQPGVSRLITAVSFPKLESIGTYGMYFSFGSCPNLTSISFPALKSIKSHGMSGTFSLLNHSTGGIKGEIYFPSLTTVETDAFSSCFYRNSQTSDITVVHFKKSLSSNPNCQASKLWGSSAYPTAPFSVKFDLD